MSKLSIIEEVGVISSKDENWYINKCSSFNKIKDEPTPYGTVKTYQVGNEEVELYFMMYANGEDDYDEELVECKITSKLPF